MRYLTPSQVSDQLRANRKIEQIYPLRCEDGHGIVEYLSVYPNRDQSWVVNHAVCDDEGSVDDCDVYRFYGIDPDEPDGEFYSFETATQALDFCYEKYGAKSDKWQGEGMIQDTYSEMKAAQIG